MVVVVVTNTTVCRGWSKYLMSFNQPSIHPVYYLSDTVTKQFPVGTMKWCPCEVSSSVCPVVFAVGNCNAQFTQCPVDYIRNCLLWFKDKVISSFEDYFWFFRLNDLLGCLVLVGFLKGFRPQPAPEWICKGRSFSSQNYFVLVFVRHFPSTLSLILSLSRKMSDWLTTC